MEALKHLLGPVYKIDRKHGYEEYHEKVIAPQELQGPLYNIPENLHSYR